MDEVREAEMVLRVLGVMGCFVGCVGMYVIEAGWQKTSILGKAFEMMLTGALFFVAGIALFV